MDYHQSVLDLFEDARAAGLLESAVHVKLTVRVDDSARLFNDLKSLADESVESQFTKILSSCGFQTMSSIMLPGLSNENENSF